MEPTLTHDLAALGQVMLIDIALAGDNAVVVGLAVAGLPAPQRRLAILLGIGGATVVRIGFGLVALDLLQILGLLLAGGLLLLWVAWKMFRELRRPAGQAEDAAHDRSRTLGRALLHIVLADVSMSLDNVLAVAGAAGGRGWVLVLGLAVSVALMGLAADLLARVLQRQRWIAWAGLAMVLFVALRMIWEGAHQVAGALA
ncbi:MAG: YjbE family putative metal transport protein [Rhodospirillales bacterium]|jgi:YjbE family integral membrane protein|nr:YjbE family putative metal transport protein [Rhodospirillales bacterium]